MRITMLASSYPRFVGDGTAPFVRSIAEQLVGLGHTVTVVAPYDPEVQLQSAESVPVYRFWYAPFKKWHIMGHGKSLTGDTNLRGVVYFLLPFFLLSEFLSTIFLAIKYKSQIIYAHWVLPNGLVGALAAMLLRIPLVLSLHGSDIFVATKTPLFGKVAGWVFKHAAKVTACSPHLLDGALSLGCDPEKILLLPWGVDPIRFSPSVNPLLRTDWGLSADFLLLITLGRLVSKKGFAILIQALPELVAQFPHLHLVIGGSGPLFESLQTQAQNLGIADHLHMVGAVDWECVPNFLAMGDVFVLPSIYDSEGNVDGLPTVLLEAMGVGKPVVASDIGGVGLVIKHAVNGLLVPPGEVESLLQSLTHLSADPILRDYLGIAARRAVETQFNWRSVVEQIAELMNQTLLS